MVSVLRYEDRGQLPRQKIELIRCHACGKTSDAQNPIADM